MVKEAIGYNSFQIENLSKFVWVAFMEWLNIRVDDILEGLEVYDDGKCEGGSLKGKPLTSYFTTLMYRACRLAIKCTTNIDIFPF